MPKKSKVAKAIDSAVDEKEVKAIAAKAQAAAASAEKEKQVSKIIFKHTGSDPVAKLPPQAQGIVNILKEAGENGLRRDQLIAAMEGVIETKQPQARILSYYQTKLVESGAVTMEKPEAAPVEEKTEAAE